jgi:hypothetical protein
MNSTQWFKDVKRKDQMLYDILIGKFHADIISATPNGSGRIIAVLGIVASAIDTCSGVIHFFRLLIASLHESINSANCNIIIIFISKLVAELPILPETHILPHTLKPK